MGRHSRTDGSGTEPGRWGGLRQRTHDDASVSDPVEEFPTSNVGYDGVVPAPTTARAAALMPTGNDGAEPVPVSSNSIGDLRTRPADQTQVIPRVLVAAPSTWPPAVATSTPEATAPASSPPARPYGPISSDETAVFARPVLDGVNGHGTSTAEPTIESAPEEPVPDQPAPEEADEPGYTRYTHDSPTNHQRLMWPALVVFWLLALGAGIVCLASLGAPHYLCTGAAKGLACHRTGTVIAAILTVLVIAVVGVVSVFAIEARRRGLAWLRHLGIGVVILALVAGGGYLLIRTIGG